MTICVSRPHADSFTGHAKNVTFLQLTDLITGALEKIFIMPQGPSGKLLSQGYKINHFSNTFKKFYGRHTDLDGQYKKNVCQMFADSIS